MKNKKIKLTTWAIKTREKFTIDRFEKQLEDIFLEIKG